MRSYLFSGKGNTKGEYSKSRKKKEHESYKKSKGGRNYGTTTFRDIMKRLRGGK